MSILKYSISFLVLALIYTLFFIEVDKAIEVEYLRDKAIEVEYRGR